MQNYYVGICTVSKNVSRGDRYMVLHTVPGWVTALPKFKAAPGEDKPELKLQLTDKSSLPGEGNWTFVPAWGRRKNLPPSSEVPLHSRHDTLGLKNEEHMSNWQDPGKVNHVKLIQLERKPTHVRTSATRKAHKVLAMGDSLLRGTKTPIYHPDNFSREVCCLQTACVHGVREAAKPGEPFRLSSAPSIPCRL